MGLDLLCILRSRGALICVNNFRANKSFAKVAISCPETGMSLVQFSTPPDGLVVGINKGQPLKLKVCNVAEVGGGLSL